jgi:hypothetical protein
MDREKEVVARDVRVDVEMLLKVEGLLMGLLSSVKKGTPLVQDCEEWWNLARFSPLIFESHLAIQDPALQQ